jgi:hypothetical protein
MGIRIPAAIQISMIKKGSLAMEEIRPQHISEGAIKQARGEIEKTIRVDENDPKAQLTETLLAELRNTPDEEMSEEYHRYMAWKAEQNAAEKEKAVIKAKKKVVSKKAAKTAKQSRKKNRK